MLSPEYLEHLPEPLINLWQQVEDDILRDIGRRIRKMGTLTDTAAYQAFRIEQTKLLQTDIVKLISKYSGKSETAIRKMLQDAAVETLRSEDAIHAAAGVVLPPINESKNLLNLLNAGYRQTIGTWKNLTVTTANTVTRQFEDALDRAWLQISSGAFDYQTAIRNAVDDLAQHMDGVTYPSGHHDTLEVAVRRAALTGVNQTCGKLQWERMEQAGCEFVEVSAHSGAREFAGGGPKDHAGWQGKVYHIGGAIWYEGVYYEDFVAATGYGTGDGLCGWNCRHNFCSFWPGISTRVYTDEQLANLSAKNIEYNGKMYSKYEISQMQREKERNVRKWKKTWISEKEAGLDTTGSAVRLKNARKNLDDFVKATGGRVDSIRTATWNTTNLPGKRFSHSQAAYANWDVRREESRIENHRKNLQFIKDDATIKASSGLPKKLVGLPDEKLKHTLNVDVSPTGTSKFQFHAVAPEGVDMSKIEVMAGNGTCTPIRDLRRLYETYGLSPDGWQKKSGTAYGKEFHYVIHWYEHNGFVPLEEIKLKGMKKNK